MTILVRFTDETESFDSGELESVIDTDNDRVIIRSVENRVVLVRTTSEAFNTENG